MCKKYVNVSTRCYKSITTIENSVISYNAPFTIIRHEDCGEGVAISDFAIVTDIDFLGTNNEEHKKENPLESRKKLDFIIRLTKCSLDERERIGYDLASFSIDLNELYEAGLVNKACFGFINCTRTTNVDKLELPGGLGRYVIKVLIKDSEDKEYTIQAMSQLNVV